MGLGLEDFPDHYLLTPLISMGKDRTIQDTWAPSKEDKHPVGCPSNVLFHLTNGQSG